MNYNRAIIAGRVVAKPEARSLDTGKVVTTFTIATSYKHGENETTEFHNIVAWENLAKTIVQYVEKGQVILIEGRLQTTSWEKDGVKRYKTEIVAEKMQFGQKAKGSHSGQSEVEQDIDNIF